MFAGRGRRYEFKVEHGGYNELESKKFVKFFIKEQEMKSFTPDMLIQQLKDKCHFSNILNVKYMDRDKDWIDLRCSDFESFVDLVESAEVVPDRQDILRITLKVASSAGSSQLSQCHEAPSKSKRFYSPSPNSKQSISKKRTKVKIDLTDSQSDADGIVGTALDDIEQLAQDEALDEAETREMKPYEYISPTQKFFAKLESEEQRLLAVVREKEFEVSELENSCQQPKDQAKVPLCTNCHTPGHNKAHCLFTTCVSATLCNDIKRHPEEMKYLKGQREELKTFKGKLAKIQADLKSKREMLSGVQNSFVAKVQTDLINSDPKKYLRKVQTGQFVPNWLVVNSDIRKLERVCHGKLPSKAEIPTLLQSYNDRFDILRKLDTDSEDDDERVNPVKQLWEKKGVRFPGRGSLPNTVDCAINSQKTAYESVASTSLPIHFTEPKSKREEDYLFQIGLSQSLQTIQPENVNTVCNDSSEDRETDVEEVVGLHMLFEAAKILEK